MPIKGLTDQQAQFPRVGVLRKGAAKAGNAPGADLKYFRFTDADDKAAADFKAVYGDAPVAIRVLLPYRAPEENFHAWLEEYTASSLIRRCDGETQVLTRVGTRYDQTPRPCLRAQGKPCNCKQSGRLFVIVPELKRAGYVVALTTSKHDIKNLSAQLAAAAAIVGDLSFRVPFILSRKPVKISTPNGNKLARREKWLLSIEIDPSFVQAKLTAMQRDALLQLNAPVEPLLDEPDDDDELVEAPARQPAPAPAISLEEARRRYADAANTAVNAVGQLSQAGRETEAAALDKLIAANRVNAKGAALDHLLGAADALAQATREALAGNGELQAEALVAPADDDQDEAPAEEAEQPAQPEQAPVTVERLKRQVAEAAARRAGQKASEKQRQMAFLALREACGGDDAKRHTVQTRVLGVDKFEHQTDAQVLALIDWLKPFLGPDKKYHPNQAAAQDVARVANETLESAGQQQLPLG
jgi:hypothetical protein